MGLGTKNRQKQTADICKQHLREKYRDQRGLVEEFILEFEGTRENCDVTRWDRFAESRRTETVIGPVHQPETNRLRCTYSRALHSTHLKAKQPQSSAW